MSAELTAWATVAGWVGGGVVTLGLLGMATGRVLRRISQHYPTPPESDPWGEPCVCGHPMRGHILDWDLDPAVYCHAIGCDCPEFRPAPKVALSAD